MIAIKTIRRVRSFLAVLSIFVLIVGCFTLVSPVRDYTFSHSYVWWLVGVPAYLGVWFVLEWCGTFLLELPFWQKMPSVLRIIFLVLLIVLVVVAYLFLQKEFASHK